MTWHGALRDAEHPHREPGHRRRGFRLRRHDGRHRAGDQGRRRQDADPADRQRWRIACHRRRLLQALVRHHLRRPTDRGTAGREVPHPGRRAERRTSPAGSTSTSSSPGEPCKRRPVPASSRPSTRRRARSHEGCTWWWTETGAAPKARPLLRGDVSNVTSPEPVDWHVETRGVVKYFGGQEALGGCRPARPPRLDPRARRRERRREVDARPRDRWGDRTRRGRVAR